MLTSRIAVGLLTLVATVLATACTPSQPETEAPPPAAPTEDTQTEAPETSPPEESPADTPQATATSRMGTFESAEHETTGTASLTAQDGMQTLVFDDSFSTSSGPDLVVVLHRSATLLDETTPPAYPLDEEDYVVIAPLESTTGMQEYIVPAEVDISAFESVAVWCQEFNATFGAAALQ